MLPCDNKRREMDSGKLVGAVYIDLSQAFETIGHGILLKKLESYGIIGNELVWFTDYLINRNHIVEINDARSDEEPIFCGVPQGSILRPLLFIIFLIMRTGYSIQIDHIRFYYSNIDVNVIEDILNLEMDGIGKYYRENELLLNLKKGKTEVMLFWNI